MKITNVKYVALSIVLFSTISCSNKVDLSSFVTNLKSDLFTSLSTKTTRYFDDGEIKEYSFDDNKLHLKKLNFEDGYFFGKPFYYEDGKASITYCSEKSGLYDSILEDSFAINSVVLVCKDEIYFGSSLTNNSIEISSENFQKTYAISINKYETISSTMHDYNIDFKLSGFEQLYDVSFFGVLNPDNPRLIDAHASTKDVNKFCEIVNSSQSNLDFISANDDERINSLEKCSQYSALLQKPCIFSLKDETKQMFNDLYFFNSNGSYVKF